ncbi:MAG: hypothetical protein ACLU3N_08890 [Lachnospiraceae bacterium]
MARRLVRVLTSVGCDLFRDRVENLALLTIGSQRRRLLQNTAMWLSSA